MTTSLYSDELAAALAVHHAHVRTGGDPDAPVAGLFPATMLAARLGKADVLDDLLARGARLDPNTHAQFGSPLVHAADQRHRKCAQLLIDAGIAVDLIHPGMGTALGRSVTNDDVPMARLLLDGGADPNRSYMGVPPVLRVVSLEMAETLLDAGAEPLTRDPEDRTVLHGLAQNQDADAARLAPRFVAAGVPIDARAHRGRATALMLAGASGQLAAIESLVAAGADVGAGTEGQDGPPPELWDVPGITALHAAAAFGRFEAARRLLALGADPAQRTRDGDAPDALASRTGHARLADLLRAALPDPA